ncbi:MAG: IclR family transcriptional regulator [Paenibacillaceae bacterium]|uniref:IclR family transcriptional regulator n=1 Tax=Paenibacillus cymbidii TaxID=1639034 RepID=UPI0010820849|nr:IclR family transcriptional regulator [Paenibacillus cymbidii]MBO9608098.1 IclR family transcriptional regulator [Paenibacillaceae bacterium]
MDDGKLTVRAVERALDVLICFTDSAELSLTEISARVGLHKSTVHRLLASLEGRGFLVRSSATDKYKLGLRIWELSAHLSHSDDPAVALLPEMERLRDTIGETVSLYIRDGLERVRIQAVESTQAIRRVAPVGARMPLYVGASGKVLVAFETRQVERDLLSARDWPASLDPQAYRGKLAEARKTGFAMSIEEREPGAAAIAAPIFSRSHKLVAALAISGPSNRLTADKMREDAPHLIAFAARMGKMIR